MILEFFEPFRKIKRGLDGYISSRKAFVLVLIGMVLLLYIGPNIFRWLMAKSPKILVGSNGECIETQMYKFEDDINKFDAAISKSNNGNSKGYLFYVGNGKIALSVDDNKIYIYNKRSLSLPIDYHPVLLVDVPGARSQEGTLLHFTNGIAYKFQCFSLGRFSLSVTHRFLASRSVPSLLIQSIDLYNPSSQDVIVHLKKATNSELKSQTVQVKESDDDVLKYKLYSGLVDVRENSEVISFSVISPDVPDSLIVEAKSSKTISVRTIVHYSDPTPLPPFENTVKKIKEFSQKELKRTLENTVSDLIKSHVHIWKQIWHSGFGISLSKALGALNGDVINATLYYIMSNTREYMSEWDASPQYQQVLQKFLYTPDKCYGGHHTLQASKLWSNLRTLRSVNDVVSLWFLTLIKQGCQNLMKAGASGVMQAMILSFGGFKFSNHHLEFDCEPKDLHRDYHFRRIIYGNSTHINISVIVQEDNKAIIYTALDRSDRDYYACDAGCLDTPIKLGAVPAQFPVKITNPLTAILYVTSDKQHMEELKHTIHVKEVVEAPAHEHHIIALHRHGHMLGGLPAFFWVSIAFLIAVFHLFLIKLIYNEYCGNAEKSRKRYNV